MIFFRYLKFISSRFSLSHFQRSDIDLVFDDSTLSDDKLSAVNTNHDSLRTKLVSKRSVSDPSDNNENSGLWWRLKRGVKNLFGYKSDDESHSVEVPKVEELKAVPVVIPAQKFNSVHDDDKTVGENAARRRRQHDDDDDNEDDEDEDDEASGEGEITTNRGDGDAEEDNDVIQVISTLPDIPDGKYCEYYFSSSS